MIDVTPYLKSWSYDRAEQTLLMELTWVPERLDTDECLVTIQGTDHRFTVSRVPVDSFDILKLTVTGIDHHPAPQSGHTALVRRPRALA